MAHHFLGGGVGIHALQGGGNLGRGIAQLLQCGVCQGGGVGLGGGGRRNAGGEIQLRGAAPQLVLQLQNDPLSDLLAHSLRGGEHFFIPGHHRQGEILGAAGGENGHGGLGADAVDTGEQVEAALLLPAGKAVQVVGILPDGFGDIEPGTLVQLQLPGGIGGDAAAVAHAAAVDDGKARLQHGDSAGYIVEHGFPPKSYFAWAFASRLVDDRAWHRAMATASAASSGLGMAERCRSRLVMSCIWCLVAPP